MKTLALCLVLLLAPLARAQQPAAAPPGCPDSLGAFLAGQGFSSIELSQNTAKQFEVEAKLNGTVKLLLIVDTGASMSMLDRDKLEEAGIEWEKTEIELAGFGGSQKLYSAQIANLTIGTAETGQMSIFGADLSELQATQKRMGSRPVDGLIGADFLARYSAVIEVKHSTLFLRTR